MKFPVPKATGSRYTAGSSIQPWDVVNGNDNLSGVNEFTDRWDFFGNPSNFKASSSSLPYCTGTGAGGCSVTSGVSGMQSFFTAAQSTAMWQQCVAKAPDQSTLEAAGCYVKGNSVLVPNAAGAYGTMGRNI